MPSSHQAIEEAFVAGLREVLGRPNGLIALHEPEFSGDEWKFVKDTLDTTFVSSVGKYVDQFESMLADYTGAKFAVAVANGTVALQIAITLSGVNASDEVLVPALSFVATANAVVHAGAIPHFVDSSEKTLGMDPVALDDHLKFVAETGTDGVVRNRHTGRRIAAILPMHTYGHPVDLDGLLDVAARYKLPIVEDAAESLGSTYKGRHTGTFGLLGTLSFNGNKTITTGGGGAILTNDPKLGHRAKSLTTTAKRAHRWEFYHDEIAWNFRLPNLNAALGCAQMQRLDDFVEKKRRLAKRYQKVFSTVPAMHMAIEPPDSKSNYWLNAVLLSAPDKGLRDQLLGSANDAGFQCRPAWSLLSRLPMYAGVPRAPLPVAESLEARLINVPSSPKLAELPK